MASPLDLYSFVSGEYDAGRKQRDGNRLKALYQQALSGPSQNQRAIIGQVAGIDPSQAKGLYDLLNSRAEDQRKSVGQRAAMVRALPQEQRQAAYEGIRPDLDAAGLFAPEGADEGYLGAVAQTYGGLGSAGDSAEWRMFNNLTSMGNLTPEERAQAARVKLRLAPGAVGAARKAVTIKLRNGQEVPGEFDPELGYSVWDSSQNMMVPLGRGDISGVRDNSGGQGQRAPTQNDMEGDIALANSMIAAGIPETQVDAFLRNRGQRAEQPGAIAPSGIQSMVGSQTPGEQSYGQEVGKTQAQLDSGDAVTRMEAERAAAKARAEAAAKAQADVDAKAATRTRDADQTLALLDEAERILPQATGSRAGSVRDSLAGMAGIATEGAKASDSLKIIAAELVAKVPRFEGPQSNIDVQFYREAAGDLANDQLPVERRMAALQTIRRLRQKHASAQPAKRSYTQQEALQKLQDARRAIGSGADREAVRQRLRDLGLNNIAERL